MEIAQIVAGILLIVAGRPLFWFFIGVIGFILGGSVGMLFFPDGNIMARLLIMTGCGFLSIWLSFVMRKAAVAAAGAAAAGYLAAGVVSRFSVPEPAGWGIIALAALLGLLLGAGLLEWALIILSSLTGAALIVRLPFIPGEYAFFVLLALSGAGIVIQVIIYMYRK